MRNTSIILFVVVFFSATAMSQTSNNKKVLSASIEIWNKYVAKLRSLDKEKARKKWIIETSAYTGTSGSKDLLTGRSYPGKSYLLKVYIGYGYEFKRDDKGFYLQINYGIFKRGSAAEFCNTQDKSYKIKYRLHQDINFNDKKAYINLSTFTTKKLPYWQPLRSMVCVYPEGKYQSGINKMLKRLNNAQENFVKKLNKNFSFEVDLKEHINSNMNAGSFKRELDKDLDHLHRVKG